MFYEHYARAAEACGQGGGRYITCTELRMKI